MIYSLKETDGELIVYNPNWKTAYGRRLGRVCKPGRRQLRRRRAQGLGDGNAVRRRKSSVRETFPR